MHLFTTAKLYLLFAVLLCVAKPFLGFSMFNRVNPPAENNIFIKVFSKRKQEDAEDSSFDGIAMRNKLIDPGKRFFLRFCSLLSILFPAIFNPGVNITNRFLRRMQLGLVPIAPGYLLNCNLII
jgi:hypothetical protein